MRANWQLHGFLTAVLMARNGTAMPQARGKAEVEAKRAERTPTLPHGQPRAWAYGEMEKAAGEATDGNGRKNGARCDGKCSALQWATQRAEMTDAACCIFQATFTGNPKQSALISPPAYSSTQINQPSHRHRLSSAHLPAHVSSLTSTSYILMKLILLSQQARSFSIASTLVFRSKRTRFPQQARSASTASALVFHGKKHLSSSTRALATTLPEHLPSPDNTIVFHNQNVRLPLPTRSASPASTFGFHNQNVRLPLPARLSPPASTFSSSCQNPRNPQPTESPSQPTGSPASIQAARAAR